MRTELLGFFLLILGVGMVSACGIQRVSSAESATRAAATQPRPCPGIRVATVTNNSQEAVTVVSGRGLHALGTVEAGSSADFALARDDGIGVHATNRVRDLIRITYQCQ